MRPIYVALFGVLAVSSACTKKAEGQTVAIVNDDEITVAELNAEIGSAKLPNGVDGQKARSQVLQSMIDRRLLAQAAEKDGIDKSPDFLGRQRRLNEELLIKMLVDRQGGSAQMPSESEISQFEAAHPQMFARREIWSLDQLRFHLPEAGPVSQQIAKTKSLQELEQVLSANGIAATRGNARIDTSIVPDDMLAKISALSPGEPFIIPVGTEAVASVIRTRQPQPLVGDDAKPVAVAALRKQQTGKVLRDRLEALRHAAKIEYKSGFAPPKK